MTALPRSISVVSELGPLPQTAARLAAVVADSSSSVDDVVSVVQYDQALTAQVLKYANSAASAALRQIATVREAVVRLGGARILTQLMARHVKDAFCTALPVYGYEERELWRHSVASAVAAETIGRFSRSALDGLCFTAALLHDVGKLILCRTAPRADMERIWELVRSSGCTWDSAEREVLGFSHADAGAELIAAWQLPHGLVSAVRNHHVAQGPVDRITCTVMVANVVARTIGMGIGDEGMSLAVCDDAAGQLDLSRENFERVCVQSALRLNEVMELYE